MCEHRGGVHHPKRGGGGGVSDLSSTEGKHVRADRKQKVKSDTGKVLTAHKEPWIVPCGT